MRLEACTFIGRTLDPRHFKSSLLLLHLENIAKISRTAKNCLRYILLKYLFCFAFFGKISKLLLNNAIKSIH